MLIDHQSRSHTGVRGKTGSVHNHSGFIISSAGLKSSGPSVWSLMAATLLTRSPGLKCVTESNHPRWSARCEEQTLIQPLIFGQTRGQITQHHPPPPPPAAGISPSWHGLNVQTLLWVTFFSSFWIINSALFSHFLFYFEICLLFPARTWASLVISAVSAIVCAIFLQVWFDFSASNLWCSGCLFAGIIYQ